MQWEGLINPVWGRTSLDGIGIQFVDVIKYVSFADFTDLQENSELLLT